MTGRRVFLVAFLLTTLAWAAPGAVLRAGEAPGTAPPPHAQRPAAPAGPNIATEGRSSAAGKQAMGIAWSSTWSATVPKGQAVPARALGAGRCPELFGWATARSAVPRGRATAAFTLAAPGDTGLVVRSLRVVKGRSLPAPEGRDVACLGAADRSLAPGMERWGQLSLDRPRTLKLSRSARPGGTVGGVIETSTADCSCEWWIELEVWEGDKRRTVRIDDAGKPFTLAPPVPPVGTPADGGALKYGTADLALARPEDTGGRPSNASSVSASRLLAESGQEMWMVADRAVPAVGRITANLDVPGAVCQHVERALIAADARPAGRAAYAVHLADPSSAGDAQAVADVSLNVEKVVRQGAAPRGYGCYPDKWDLQMNAGQLRETVRLSGDAPRLPVLTAESVALSRASEGAPATGTFFFGVEAWDPGNVEYHFTLDVTVEHPSGKRTRHTVDDAGRPFVLAARSHGRSASHEKHAWYELGRWIG